MSVRVTVAPNRKRLMASKVMLGFAVAACIPATASAALPRFTDWGTGYKLDALPAHSSEINTRFLDGCPILSPDGRSLFIASDRPGGQGGLDIWVATRARRRQPFGPPQNLPAPVNSSADDFCPTPLRDGRLLFVSRRVIPGSCGLGDIYLARRNGSGGWLEPEHLACDPAGPNSTLDEQGPSYLKRKHGAAQLFFSRSSPTVPGELYVSDKPKNGSFGPASAIKELNTAGNDIQPNVRTDGLEIVFSSNHPHPGARGGQDIYRATRVSVDDPWSVPANLGSAINTPAGETRPSLSWAGRTLLFGRAPGPEGSSDIYVSVRRGKRGT